MPLEDAPQKPYQWLAEYYDQFFNFHHGWIEAAHTTILKPVWPKVRIACDLACGTGNTAIKLAQKGIKTYGVDLSPVMVKAAREKVKAAGVKAKITRGDMRDFYLPEPVDLILCEFDAINHIPETSDLSRVAACAAAALEPGGHFFFDVNMKRAFTEIWSNTWFVEKPGVALIMNSGFDKKAAKGWIDVEWFIQQKDSNLWERKHEHVEQVCWSDREIRRTLRDAGFDWINVWDATPFFTNDPFITPGCRSFYLARKRRSR